MIADHLVIGSGEVGMAHFNLIREKGICYRRDKDGEIFSGSETTPGHSFDMLHICYPYMPGFIETTVQYIDQYNPDWVNICATVPPGTCRQIAARVGITAVVHSTTRGLHPNLYTGLKTVGKHISGPQSEDVANLFTALGFRVSGTHPNWEVTELAHILNNAAYGVFLMFADEMSGLCREYGVDYLDTVMNYTRSNNEGYQKLGLHRSRPVVTPPNGKIGGHCVTMSAGLIPEEIRKKYPLLDKLARYNDK